MIKNRDFGSIISFMQGTSWAIVVIGAFLFFTLFYPFGLILALIGGFFGGSLGLWMVVFFEMAHIKQEMHKEKIKHTKLLEEIVTLMKEKKI